MRDDGLILETGSRIVFRLPPPVGGKKVGRDGIHTGARDQCHLDIVGENSAHWGLVISWRGGFTSPLSLVRTTGSERVLTICLLKR
jgi:hypothetical protein